LAAVRDPELVLPTIARGLGIEVPTDRSPDEVLAAALHGRDACCVLDNVEQIAGAAGEIARLLAGCESVTVLATSREPLHLRAEHEVPVPPLAVRPPPRSATKRRGDDSLARYEAVALFLQRARAVRPEAVASRPALAAVATLCGRLDGLPLAIELAAARVRELTPEAMLAGLGDRLGLLAGGYRDLPARQRTMRDAIAWSYDLLSADEQRVFRRLSAFVGGGTVEGAAAVVGAVGSVPDVAAALQSLAAKHLIAIDDGDPARFAIWETIRDYAAEQLEAHGETRAAGAAHFAHHLGLADEAGPHLAGPDAGRWLERLEPERDNLRAALAWGLRDDPEGALQLSRAVARYWDFGGLQREGDRRMRRVLTVAVAPTIERARVLNEAGWIASSLGDLDRSMALFQEALTIWQAHGDRVGAIRSLGYLGMGAGERGDVVEAVSYHAASLAMARRKATPGSSASCSSTRRRRHWRAGTTRPPPPCSAKRSRSRGGPAT
jgi:predicted ATPase